MDKLVSLFEKLQNEKLPVNRLKKCDYRIETIEGRPCVVAKKAGSCPHRALMLFFGGGYFMPPDKGDYANIVEIANTTDTEVWFPLYPLAPKARMSVTMKCVLAVYQKMLDLYSAEKIVLYGNSSGAALCLYLCMYIQKNQYAIPFPKHLIMVSPGMQLPPSRQQRERMKELEKTDYMIPIKFCNDIPRVLLDEETKYLFNPFFFDWTGYPDMDVFYGTCEIFSAYIPDFQKTADKSDVKLTIHLGEGMMHCWTQLSGTTEGKEAREKIYDIIKSIG
jgi:acetyl esterase/lipase